VTLAAAYLLIGAGGHAKAVVEAGRASFGDPTAYVDPNPADWLAVAQIRSDLDVKESNLPVIIGVGGVCTAELVKRLELLDEYLARGHFAPVVVHPYAYVSHSARLESGTIVLAGAIIQPAVAIGRGVIVNTRAVIEHDSTIGDGAHVAPGAVVLGGCRVGRCAMIGANAVVLPGTSVADEALVPAMTRHG
jgi:sugar O-acyltransferase (sialic acid O-acetyltransferase NeuD family)